jgi:Fic family protein
MLRLVHLVFVKIHPFQDGNGRTARLIEKWFLLEQFGEKANAIQLEKNYFTKTWNVIIRTYESLAWNTRSWIIQKAWIFC